MAGTAAADRPGAVSTVSSKAWSDRVSRPWLFPLLAFAATWVLIAATWNVANAIYRTPLRWTHYFWIWDAGFYSGIARYGYPVLIATRQGLGSAPMTATGRAAFFPLLPALLRLVTYVTGGHYLEAGLIVQILIGAASALAVWALADRIYDRRVADRAVLLYCAFPGAMAFAIFYTEPLEVALAAGCLLAAINRRWLLAGVLALLAGAAHSSMIVLTPVLAVAAVQAVWSRREWRALVAPVLAPLGILGFFAYYGHRYHDYLFWFRIEHAGWHQHIDWGKNELSIITWINPGTGRYPIYLMVVAIMFWVALIGILLLLFAQPPLPVFVYTVLIFIACVVSYDVTTKPRYILTMFPIFIGAGAKLPRWLFWPVLIISAAMLAFLIGWWPHQAAGPPP